ncbi:hypothetical protein Ccrd_010389 [Cynara cardunculus var. scolymus]|uniref:Uncharacterized protein n=1 Tax=Cynara cardunculus var. scolymus TaxID=59895 RepID=A0A118K6U7_CYNCS|nr:hypothetical protein Ccrd_010389 [Cynara cardunculus var. scolymus]
MSIYWILTLDPRFQHARCLKRFKPQEKPRTTERFDPREHSWKKIETMYTMRCPSMVVLNEKL